MCCSVQEDGRDWPYVCSGGQIVCRHHFSSVTYVILIVATDLSLHIIPVSNPPARAIRHILSLDHVSSDADTESGFAAVVLPTSPILIPKYYPYALSSTILSYTCRSFPLHVGQPSSSPTSNPPFPLNPSPLGPNIPCCYFVGSLLHIIS